jgi:hypothetical protein
MCKAHFWGKDPKAFGDEATLGTIAIAFEPVAIKCRKALAFLREQAMVDEAAAQLLRRKPVSPTDCKHDRTLFIQGGHGAPPAFREHVTLCADCGTFLANKEVEGKRINVRFQLVTEEQVEAAGQFARLLEEEIA